MFQFSLALEFEVVQYSNMAQLVITYKSNISILSPDLSSSVLIVITLPIHVFLICSYASA